MAGKVPSGRGGIALHECMAYGTIASEVVTHRILLQRCCSLNMEYTIGQPLKRPFHNSLEKCTVVNARFKQPEDADRLENLQVLCTEHHRAKTKTDLKVLSRVR